MRVQQAKFGWLLLAVAATAIGGRSHTQAQEPTKKATSYSPVDQTEGFATVMGRMKSAKAAIAKKHEELLAARYDLGNHAAAYFDGDIVIATKKGVNVRDRGSQVHPMAEFQELLDFPPAPKLNVMGKLDPKQATES